MTTREVANKLVEYCRKGDWHSAQTELYAADAVSIEPKGARGPELTSGLDNIIAKGKQWENSVEQIHSMELEGPLVSSNHFSCTMTLDMKMKGMDRMKSDQICVYEVKDGKIVKEQFFYPV